jgi:hypothetical protein
MADKKNNEWYIATTYYSDIYSYRYKYSCGFLGLETCSRTGYRNRNSKQNFLIAK